MICSSTTPILVGAFSSIDPSNMDFEDIFFNFGAPTHMHVYRADVCLLIVLWRLSFLVCLRFYDMVEDFGITSHRLC